MKYLDESLELSLRIDALIDEMTLDEKISQLVHESKDIGRLGIKAYNWWNEALHGVARAGMATVFPQPIAFGATFDADLIYKVADVISTEARAKYNIAQKYGDYSIYKGLNFWSPNINIYRDPRWGRGHETYGEDPYLTSHLGVAFVRGLQGEDSLYLKTIATPKHYVVHSGPEAKRHVFDAIVSKKDLHETYLKAFKATVVEGEAEGVMSAYNKVNNMACCASEFLLKHILRDQWQFKGHVVSDCNGLLDLHETHKVSKGMVDSAAHAINSGCDLNCGKTYGHLTEAVELGYVSESTIDTSLRHILRSRFKLGMFDDMKKHPYAQLNLKNIATKEHRQVAREVCVKSSVLLKNNDNRLPITDKYKRIAVIGPNADVKQTLLGNYYGTPLNSMSVLDGVRMFRDDILYSKGCEMLPVDEECMYADARTYFSEATEIVSESDIAILVMGLSPTLEGEEGDATNADAAGDRYHLKLPAIQRELIETLSKTKTPLVLVLINGGPLAIEKEIQAVDAALECWYPGAEGGKSIAEMLFGVCSPQGKLPMTFVKSIDDLPNFEDYSMKNRTYRYSTKTPLFPFGYGKTYGECYLENMKRVATRSFEGVLSNNSDYNISETIQVYMQSEEPNQPVFQLIKVMKVEMEAHSQKNVVINLETSDFTLFNEEGQEFLSSEPMKLFIGTQLPDELSRKLTTYEVFDFQYN